MLRWTVRVALLLTFPLWGLMLLGWKIFVKLVNFIGIQEIRNCKGALQTPSHCYEHSETKQIVLLIGMTHIAEKAYFEDIYNIAKFLEEKGRYKILYEFVRIKPEEVETLDPIEKEFHEQLLVYRSSHQKIAEAMSLQYQFDTDLVFYALPSWICNDVEGKVFFQKFIKEGMMVASEAEKVEKLIEKTSRPAIQWLVNKMFSEAAATFLVAKIMCRIIPSKKKFLGLILDWRNEIAARGILEEIRKGNNVVSIWGAAHLPGIGKLLEEKGFVKISVDWTTAYQKRKYSLLKAILSL